jgi:hypothetical protein
VLKRAMKYVPQSDDMARAFDREDDDADFEVTSDYSSAQFVAGVSRTGTAGLRDRVLARKEPEPEPVHDTADGNP